MTEILPCDREVYIAYLKSEGAQECALLDEIRSGKHDWHHGVKFAAFTRPTSAGQSEEVDRIAWHKPAHRAVMASVHLGKWMSAALDDPDVCEDMKADIREWFSAGEPVGILSQALSTLDLPAVQREARREAMEEAAAVADGNRTDDGSLWDRAAETIADAIRAIKEGQRTIEGMKRQLKTDIWEGPHE